MAAAHPAGDKVGVLEGGDDLTYAWEATLPSYEADGVVLANVCARDKARCAASGDYLVIARSPYLADHVAACSADEGNELVELLRALKHDAFVLVGVEDLEFESARHLRIYD